LATLLAIGDLAGAFPLPQVVEQLTAFADNALDRAIRTAIAERTGDDSAAGFIALALGKQGAGELNYSSDIDPILLYEPTRLAHRAKDDPADAAQRYARRIVALLSDVTDEGYVLRVDLRLRPASEISPLVVRRAAALTHYQSAALPWERAAFTRARAAAGDLAAGEEFLTAIRPFIWRQALDFGAVDEIRKLTERVRAGHEGPDKPGPGFNLKKGRGGIREIEFFVQTHQLIHGGRDPSLRVRRTSDALGALVAAERIEAATARTLSDAYKRLRVVEHRLQMVYDRQTHSLPEGAALDNVAWLDGRAGGAELVAELTELTQAVGAIFDTLIEPEPELPSPIAAPKRKRYKVSKPAPDRAIIAARIENWRDGRFQCLRTPQALAAFDALAPVLTDALVHADDPERALIRWESLLERAPSAINLFYLLQAQPQLLHRLISALTLSAMLADELARKPELLDTLLDRRGLDDPGSVEQIAKRMELCAARPDYEAMLDAIRQVTGEIRFSQGLQMMEGSADPLDIAQALSRTAEAALQLALRETAHDFAKAHGRIEGSELVVLGLGRLGGGALTHASDLDLVFVFTGDFAAQSDGLRALGATHYYNRLASRVIAALSVPTAQGALYEIDTRLRPQGGQGPLVVSCEAFAKYQQEAAWTWEHMALARARVLAGSPAARQQLEAIMVEVLLRQRDRHKLADAVVSMRDEMARHKQPTGPLDAKRARGGLVDCEFLVHYLQLRGVAADGTALSQSRPDAYAPDLGAAIPALIDAGRLPADFRAHYDLMSRMLVAGRLLSPGGAEPPRGAAQALARACRQSDYDALLHAFAEARQRVAGAWSAILGQTILTSNTEHNNE
ncbi:MAG: bifunctional [glutamate--ammonia ligase]-adenylyl-L-tyrosine phosphorylase/[glutamate--ammonia-ligase] adenylyltransferase, partial [Pseudomonadota bacterium]